jgi:phospholipid/cholesterol/gamma-HCH transport system substrate-binding protein
LGCGFRDEGNKNGSWKIGEQPSMVNATAARERKAAIFVGAALVLSLLSVVVWSATRGWWKSKVYYQTVLATADGVREGTPVQMSGVRIGTIRRLQFADDATVLAELAVYETYKNRIRSDSRVHLLRPFVVGDKVAVITPGTPNGTVVDAGAMLPSDEVLGLTELLNGSKLIPYMQTLENVATELRRLADQMVSKKGTDSIMRVLQAMPPLLERLASVAKTMDSNAPQLAGDFGKLVGNLAEMTDHVKKVMPVIADVAPELPKSSRRVVEALDEAVVVLKAMQKTFLLRSSVREVREEEEAMKTKRLPASQNKE